MKGYKADICEMCKMGHYSSYSLSEVGGMISVGDLLAGHCDWVPFEILPIFMHTWLLVGLIS